MQQKILVRVTLASSPPAVVQCPVRKSEQLSNVSEHYCRTHYKRWELPLKRKLLRHFKSIYWALHRVPRFANWKDLCGASAQDPTFYLR